MTLNKYNFFLIEQQEEIITKLSNKVSPLKYCYMINAKEWIEFCNNEHSMDFIQSDEQKLLTDNLENIFNKKELKNKKLHIIELGCGEGKDLYSIVTYCDSLNHKISILAVDLSEDFLNLVNTKISANFNMSINCCFLDFEEKFNDIDNHIESQVDKSVKNSNLKSYYIMLGNTLGNLNDYMLFLRRVFEKMKKGDELILGVHLYNSEFHENFIKYYTSHENMLFDTSLLRYFGLKNLNGNFIVEFNDKNRSFNTYLQCREDFDLKVFNSTIDFKKGEKILLCESKKFNSNELEEELEEIGFTNVKCFLNEDKTQLLLNAGK